MSEHRFTVRVSSDLLKRLDAFVEANPSKSRSSATVLALDAFLPASAMISRKNRAPAGAGQDAESGREGRDFGIKAGRMLAQKLGSLTSPKATVLQLPDKRSATIRTARKRNTQWGCLNTMLNEVETIICAYTKDDRNFELWEISPEAWKRHGRDASAGHKLHGKLTLISKSIADAYGKRLGNVTLPIFDE
ncbi:ribbon-helix-helix domain-containing protein [Mesorhizobium sp. ASY16-5R]|uniref:ribbon-helix-helix domain-containing protein n=1 Tax=Mesorhizobium sp. ASY16-5R TaxID=3445772 RepID=UPI003F9FB6AD